MRVLIVGASKGLGRQTVAAALAAGHLVTAFSRRPERAGFGQAVRQASGDVNDYAAVSQAVQGQDAVIITVGLPTRRAIGPPLARQDETLSRGTANVIKAMQEHGVKRLVTETAIGAGDSKHDCTPLARLAFRVVLRHLFTEKDRQEALTRSSGLDWTIVRPTALHNGPGKREVTVGDHVPAGILTNVSRTDAARTMVAMLEQPETISQSLAVTYPPRFGDTLRWLRHYR